MGATMQPDEDGPDSMASSGNERQSIRTFGPWRFDPTTGDLENDEDTIRLEPQVARLLAFFLENPETLVTRDDLIERVWDGRIVSDHAINRCVSILRGKLSPEDRNAYIETVVRRGFIGHFAPTAERARGDQGERAETASTIITAHSSPQASDASTDAGSMFGHWSGRLASRPVLLGALVIALALLAVQQFKAPVVDPRPTAAGGASMLAVLPFVTHDDSEESGFFANGIHDDLLTQLAQFESLGVISRTSVLEYADRDMNIREIGRELGADSILEGGVQRIDDRIRINAQLIDARTDTHLWADQYDRELTASNIFEVQSDIARAVADALHASLTSNEADALRVIPTDNMAAYRAFHEAMQLRKDITLGEPEYAAALERAVELDPGFVRAWAELAGSLSFQNFRNRDPRQMRRLDDILERIRRLAPDSSEFLVAQMYYTYYVLKDYSRAFQLVDLVLERRPSDLQALEVRTWIQRRLGDLEGVSETLRRGAAIDPRSSIWDTRLAWNLTLLRRYDQAAAVLERTPHDTLTLALIGALLRANSTGDLGGLESEVAEIAREFDHQRWPVLQWEALMVVRAFPEARALLDGPLGLSWGLLGRPDRRLGKMLVDWAGDGADDRDAIRSRVDDLLLEYDGQGFDVFKPAADLARALLHAVAGRRIETERLVRAWFRDGPRDQAHFINQRHFACRALGMVGAASVAVDCLREGMNSPGWALTGLEPLMPFYDPIRTTPQFMTFVAESNAAASSPGRPDRFASSF